MGGVAHADDIVQETYLRLLRVARPIEDPAGRAPPSGRVPIADTRPQRRHVMWTRSLDAETEAQRTRWMDELAAEPIQETSTLSAAAIWQKAELLRRWDAQRKAAAPIDLGEHAQVGIGLAGGLALVAWLSRQLLTLRPLGPCRRQRAAAHIGRGVQYVDSPVRKITRRPAAGTAFAHASLP